MNKIWLMAALALVTSSVHAEESFNKFYVGGGVGPASLELSKKKLDGYFTEAIELAYPPLERWSSSLDTSDLGWSIFGGYRFSKNFAVELGYLDMGESNYSGSGYASGPTGTELSWDVYGIPLSILAGYPINKYWEVFGRLGMVFTSLETDGSLLLAGLEFPAKESSNTTEFLLGAGVNLNLSPRWTIRAEWMGATNVGDGSLDAGNPDWNMAQGSILYRF